MKSSKAWMIWAVLGVCALTVFTAMGWLTHHTMVEKNARTAADAKADLEERTRLALWRMDTSGAAIVLRENQHAAEDYLRSASSPFLALNHPEVMLHFQVVEGQGLTSPENDHLNAKEVGVDEVLIAERKKRMEQLRKLLASNPMPGDEWAQINTAAEVGEVSWEAIPKVPKDAKESSGESQSKEPSPLSQNLLQAEKRRNIGYQDSSNRTEYAQRAKAVNENYIAQERVVEMKQKLQSQNDSVADSSVKKDLQSDFSQHDALSEEAPPKAPANEAVSTKTFRGAWLGGDLFLLRKLVESSGGESDSSGVIQGVWMNTEALKQQLLNEVSDLLPRARLIPASLDQRANNPMALVSFPFVLDRNETISVSSGGKLGAALKVGWTAVIIAVLAAILLVHGIMRLSDRRASFVSAVTHELRTPLTTFRLYSDMLGSGVVKEENRSHYLNVLTREADRLSHLVENVLAFSKIERGNARSQVRTATIAELIETSRERMESRLASVGMELRIHDLPALLCKVDTAAVEHILFNLVDNAAKYAADSEPAVVELSAKPSGKHLEVSVCDHGQGIPASERSRVFQAFHKSAHEAAESQPGIGLGLALSRRLAKSMGGDLRCNDSSSGACFVLALPLAREM